MPHTATMLLFLGIVVGTVLAILLVGLVLSARLKKQPVWESLRHSGGSLALVDAEQGETIGRARNFGG